jgi:hypothetical protein
LPTISAVMVFESDELPPLVPPAPEQADRTSMPTVAPAIRKDSFILFFCTADPPFETDLSKQRTNRI